MIYIYNYIIYDIYIYMYIYNYMCIYIYDNIYIYPKNRNHGGTLWIHFEVLEIWGGAWGDCDSRDLKDKL